MSQRIAVIVAIGLTVIFGSGVYAARGHIIRSNSTPSEINVSVQPIQQGDSQAAPPPRSESMPTPTTAGTGSTAGDDEAFNDDESEHGDDDEEFGDDEHDSTTSSAKTPVSTVKHESEDDDD